MFAESTNRWPIWKIGGRFRVLLFFRNVFLGQICYNFMGVSFTINIGLVSDYFERDRGG